MRCAIVLLVLTAYVSASTLPRDAWRTGFFAPRFGGPDYAESEEAPDYGDYSSLGSMFKSMQESMNNMRRQLADAMSRIPPIPRFPTHPFKPYKPSDVGFDDSKPTNSTSITKVVNGHKVTVNETTYESKDGGNAVFRIKTVNIEPHDESSAEASEPAKAEHEAPAQETSEEKLEDDASTESTEKSDKPAAENEIVENPDGDEEDQMVAESSEIWQQQDAPPPTWGTAAEWPFMAPIYKKKPFKGQYPRGYDVEMVPGLPPKPIDLSGDLKVNQLLSETVNAGGYIMPDPDSEFVEIKDGKLVPSIQTA